MQLKNQHFLKDFLLDPPVPETWPNKLRRRSARKQLAAFSPRRRPAAADRSFRPSFHPAPGTHGLAVAAMFPPAFAWHNWRRSRERGGLAMTSGRRLRTTETAAEADYDDGNDDGGESQQLLPR